jgi:hypothetical protein
MNERSLTGRPPAGDESLHTLPEIAAATGIPLDDLRLYRREFALRIPIAGGDGPRRYPQAAVETFRSIHREQTDTDGDTTVGPLVQGRRLLSLAAQRRRDAAAGNGETRSRDENGNGHGNTPSRGNGNGNGHRGGTAGERAETEPVASPAQASTPPQEEVSDPGPPSAFEELNSALALLSPHSKGAAPKPGNSGGQDRRSETGEPATSRGERPAEPVAGSSEARRPQPRRQLESRRGGSEPRSGSGSDALPTPNLPPRPPRRPTPPPQRPRAADASSSTAPDAAARFLGLGSAGEPASQSAAEPRSEADGAPVESREAEVAQPARSEPAGETVVAVEGTEPPPTRDPRPTRPIYTLQEIHELTAIPYAKLSLFAARHFDEIPWVGERYSPAYTRLGVEAFCRLYAAENPDWQVPDLGPERGWDDLGGLSARLRALAGAQERWADDLDQAVEKFLRPWTGEAQWEI